MQLPVNYDNITPSQRRLVREEYARLQDNKCLHCGASLQEKASDEMRSKKVDIRLFPPMFFRWPVHLHHNHNTGMTIGAVHARCNAVLWQYHGE